MFNNTFGSELTPRLVITVLGICALTIILLILPWDGDTTIKDILTYIVLISILPLLIYKTYLNPAIGTLVFFIFSVFRVNETFSSYQALTPYRIPFCFAFLAGLSLLIHLGLKKTTIFWTREMSYFFAFVTVVSAGVFLSYDIGVSFDAWTDWFLKLFIGFYLVTWTIRSKKDFSKVIILIVIAGCILSFNTLYHKFNAVNLVEGTRASSGAIKKSLLSDPNDLALVLLFPLSCCMSLLIIKSNAIWVRLIGLLSSFTIMSAMIATQSRGGLLGFASIMAYFISRRKKSIIIPLLSLSIALFILYYLAGIGARQSGGEGQGIDESSQNRLYAWKAAVNMALHHPLFGVGLNGFQDNYYQYAVTNTHISPVAHSIWFSVLGETGFTGLMLFIYLVYLAFSNIRKNITFIEGTSFSTRSEKNTYLNLATTIYAGLIGFCVSGSFLSAAFSWSFYMFFALTIALTHHLRTVSIP